MEYKDYRTGNIISREQYIKNGLERGELLVKERCGCVVIQDRTADAYIVFCPLHEASPDLYEALRELIDIIDNYLVGIAPRDIIDSFSTQPAKEAIAKAEGG